MMLEEGGFCVECRPSAFDGIERRRHKRFKVKDDALIFFEKETGTILDISQSGLSVHCTALGMPLLPNHLDIFFTHSRSYLPNIPVFVVGNVAVSPLPAFISFKRLGMKFGPLSNDQDSMIRNFLMMISKINKL